MEIHIGHNIKKIADEKNIKAIQLAYKWVKSPQAVYDVFKNENPKADIILKFSKLLSVPISRVFGTEFFNKQAEEVKQEFAIDELSKQLIQELRNQLKTKDRQIEFLQSIISNTEK